MATKKGKKSKGVTMSLQEFAVRVEENTGAPTPGTGQNVVYVDKKPKMPMMSSWADEEPEEDNSVFEKERIILPSTTRAARGPAYDDSEIPKHPPYTAHLGNLPYDISDEEIYKFFRDLDIADLKLPRDQQTNRLRGFGYVDFERREDLVEALIRNEQMMRGRPIRITLGTGQRGGGGPDFNRSDMRGGDDRRRGPRPPAEDEDVDDWRTVMKPQGFEEPSSDFRRSDREPRESRGGGDYGSMSRGGGGGYRDRERGGYERGPREPRTDDIEFNRSEMAAVVPPPPMQRQDYGGGGYGGRGGRGGGGGGYQNRGGDRDYYDRGGRQDYNRGGDDYNFRRGDRDGPPQGGYHQSQSSRHHSESSEDGGGGWRRPQNPSSQSSYGPPQHSYQQPQHHQREQRDQRSESPPMRRNDSPDDYERPPRSQGGDSGSDMGDAPPQPQAPKERKRLVLQPRTVDKPVGEVEAQANASIFGGAKPVDTQKREREIEEKLEKLKVEDAPEEKVRREEGEDEAAGGEEEEEEGATSSSQRPPRGGDRERERDRDRDRERPKQFSGGGAGKDSYIEVAAPFDSIKGSSSSRAHSGRPPIQGFNARFNMRSDDKDRDSDRGERGPYRGSRGGGSGPSGRRDQMDGGSRGGRGGDFRRGGTREYEGSGGGRGRSFGDRDVGGPMRRGGYERRDDDRGFRGDRDDFRRGPPSSHHHPHPHNNNQSSSIGSQEERDRDSHSEPEDDRDMIRGGGGGDRRGEGGDKGDYSDDSGDFTRVEHRRGRKSYNRMGSGSGSGPPSNNPPPTNPNPNNNKPREQPPQRSFY